MNPNNLLCQKYELLQTVENIVETELVFVNITTKIQQIYLKHAALLTDTSGC